MVCCRDAKDIDDEIADVASVTATSSLEVITETVQLNGGSQVPTFTQFNPHHNSTTITSQQQHNDNTTTTMVLLYCCCIVVVVVRIELGEGWHLSATVQLFTVRPPFLCSCYWFVVIVLDLIEVTSLIV